MSYKDPDKQKIAQREHYLKHRDLYLKRGKRRNKEQRKWFREITQGNICIVCGEDKQACLDYHHIDPSTKTAHMSIMMRYSKENILKELKKCVPLCSNCHRKFHAGLVELPI